MNWFASWRATRAVRRERRAVIAACAKRGGHFWHATPGSLVGWSCCCCPATAEGNPHDGPGLHPRHQNSRINW